MYQNLRKKIIDKTLEYRKFVYLKKMEIYNDPKKKQLYASCLAFILLLIASLVWDESHQTQQKNLELNNSGSTKSVSTLIPKGQVLVPIQLINSESLDSLLGSYGLVDLYIPDQRHPGRSLKISDKVKILRAPLNPQQFAVLVPESESAKYVHYEGPLFAVIQNPQSSQNSGTNFEFTKKLTKQIRVEFKD